MARTRPMSSQNLSNSTPSNTTRRAHKTIAPARPQTGQKTPAHQYNAVPRSTGGKTYYPKPPRRRSKRHKIVAPPLRAPRPIKRGSGALHEIRHYQKGVDHLIPKKPFERLVREVAQEHMINVRLTPKAIEALQDVAEEFLTRLFSDANLLALHARRVTVTPRDIKVVLMLRSNVACDTFLQEHLHIR